MADLINVANVADGDVPEYRFANPYDVVTVEAGGNTFLIVPGSSDSGLSVFQVEANGALTNRYNLNVSELTSAWEVASAVVGGIPYVFVTSTYGLNVFSVNANGTLNNEGVTSDFIDGGPTAFAGTWAVATGTAGGKSYVFVSGTNEYAGGGGGVTAFEVEADGDLVHRDSVFDNGNAAFNLAYPIGLATGIAGGTTYLFVAGYSDNGVSTFSVDDTDGHLTHVSSVNDNGMLHLGGTWALTTAVVSGTTYLFVAGFSENAVTVFSVGADGALTFASEVVDSAPFDNASLALYGPSSLTTAVIEGTTYLFVTSQHDNSLSVFSVAVNGALTHEDHVVDNGTTYFSATRGGTAATVAGKTYVYASATTIMASAGSNWTSRSLRPQPT